MTNQFLDANILIRPIVQDDPPRAARCEAFLRLLETGQEDALIAAHMERTGVKTIVSFDRDFDRIPGVVRREP